jgi:hypothetical protein
MMSLLFLSLFTELPRSRSVLGSCEGSAGYPQRAASDPSARNAYFTIGLVASDLIHPTA